MGIGAVVQVSLAILFGILILRSYERALASALRQSIALGLIAGAIMTVIAGGYVGGQESHWVGGVQDDAHGVPFFGWSRTGGDLRIAHFIGMHAMQGLPVIGLVAARFSERRGKLLVWSALAAWTAIAAATLLQALTGRPLFPL